MIRFDVKSVPAVDAQQIASAIVLAAEKFFEAEENREAFDKWMAAKKSNSI